MGNNSDHFTISPTSVQGRADIRVRVAVPLDFETIRSYSFSVSRPQALPLICLTEYRTFMKNRAAKSKTGFKKKSAWGKSACFHMTSKMCRFVLSHIKFKTRLLLKTKNCYAMRIWVKCGRRLKVFKDKAFAWNVRKSFIFYWDSKTKRRAKAWIIRGELQWKTRKSLDSVAFIQDAFRTVKNIRTVW